MRNNLLISKTFKIKIDGFPVKQTPKTNWHNIISFGTGTLLAISER